MVRLLSQHAELDKLYLCGGLLGDAELPAANANRFVELREVLELVQNKAAYGQVLIAFGQVEVEELVGLRYLQATGQQVFIRSRLACSIVLAVVLVL